VRNNLTFRITAVILIISQLFALIPPTTVTAQAAAKESAAVQTTASQPLALSDPLSISRVQSSYTSGRTTISFQITNNLPPTMLPEINDGATITDTVDILETFVITDDVNTLTGVALVDTLTTGTTFVAASDNPQFTSGTVSWDLPDLPPQATAVVTLTVDTPAANSDFTNLDSGAQVSAQAWGALVSASAQPALIIPTGIDAAATQGTPDADISDADMLWKSAFLGQDPIGIFEYVREFNYEPYQGSLRGTRGTLWGAAGNSVDQASLLIAMLRAAGIPALYRHGSLSTSNAQTLIAGMFPVHGGVAGYLPSGTDLADPVNDPDLIAMVKDHWWVQAYLPGSGWTDLDPSFTNAQAGEVFATPTGDSSDQITELADTLRHMVSFNLKVEQYTEFPVAGTNLQTIYPLEATFPIAQLAAKRLTLGHYVDTEELSGAFASTQHTYQPFFGIEENDDAYLGDPFTDLISNFPLSTQFTTAEWLEYTVTDLDGNTETFTRPVKDLIGPSFRTQGGALELEMETGAFPFTTLDELFINWVLPNKVPQWAYDRQANAQIPIILDLGEQGGNLLDIGGYVADGNELTSEQIDSLVTAYGRMIFAKNQLHAMMGLGFARDADAALDDIESGLLTKLYYAEPRLFAVGVAGNVISGTLEATVDLRTTSAETIVYPGQADSARFSANWAKGVTESYLEGETLERIYNQPAVTTAAIFDAMVDAGIEPLLITPDQIYLLDIYPFTPDARALMSQALVEGNAVLVPTEAVPFGEESLFAWWEIDPLTGETISVGENGLHTAAINWALVKMLAENLIEQIIVLVIESLTGGKVQTGGGYAKLAEALLEVGMGLRETFFEVADAIGRGSSSPASVFDRAGDWRYLPAHLCPVDNCGVEQFFMNEVNPAPVPLPDIAFAYDQGRDADAFALSAVPVTANQPSGEPDFSISTTPASSTLAPGSSTAIQANFSSNYDDEFTMMSSS
jgi:hypothetical protein